MTREADTVFGIPRYRYYAVGTVFVLSAFGFFISALVIVQLYVVFPPPERAAPWMRETYLALWGLSAVGVAASGAYLVTRLGTDGD